MEENYMKKYQKIITEISLMENEDGSGTPWYMEDYNCPALKNLENLFPNISFSKEDLLSLRDYAFKKRENDLMIDDLRDSAYGYSFYDRHGHSITKDEEEERAQAQNSKPELDKSYTQAFSTFFEVCEILNDSKRMEAQEFDIEEDVFSKMYEYGLETVSKNPMIKNYYKRYKSFRENEKDNENLKQENDSLKQENVTIKEEVSNLHDENNYLKQKVKKFQTMLSKTLNFCEHVKNSRFGKLFFKKQIKGLPEPDIDEEER